MENTCTKVTSMSKNIIPDTIDVKNVPKYIPQISEGRVVNVYDGDTIHIVGFVINNPQLFKFSVRLNGLDSPEIKSGKSADTTEKEIAILAQQYISNIVNGNIVTLKNVSLDKYGRLLADVYCNGIYLNKEIIDKRLAVCYDGGTKIVPMSWKKYYETGITN
jgi:endonuclease YncB( thermonuclease family)